MATIITGQLTLTASNGNTASISLPSLPYTAGDLNFNYILTYNTQSGQLGYTPQDGLQVLRGGVANKVAVWQSNISLSFDQNITANTNGIIINKPLIIGVENNASGSSSFAQGYQTTASGDYSHAEGYQTYAKGEYSHASGKQTTTIGTASFTAGLGTIASGSFQVVVGSYNAHNNTSSMFIVGGGSDDTTRKDIFTVDLSPAGSGSIMFPSNTAHPSNPKTGSMYLNSTTNKLYMYNGTAWKSASLS